MNARVVAEPAAVQGGRTLRVVFGPGRGSPERGKRAEDALILFGQLP